MEIDVSKCEFCYTVSGQPLCIIGANDTRYDDECMENPNCYYKQLQQAQEEHTQLKATLNEIEEICIECNNNSNCLKCKFYNIYDGAFDLILQLIKQAKEGE